MLVLCTGQRQTRLWAGFMHNLRFSKCNGIGKGWCRLLTAAQTKCTEPSPCPVPPAALPTSRHSLAVLEAQKLELVLAASSPGHPAVYFKIQKENNNRKKRIKRQLVQAVPSLLPVMPELGATSSLQTKKWDTGGQRHLSPVGDYFVCSHSMSLAYPEFQALQSYIIQFLKILEK